MVFFLLLTTFWSFFFGPYNNRRSNRDCASMKERVAYNETGALECDCITQEYIDNSVSFVCKYNNRDTCLGPINGTNYCVNLTTYSIKSKLREQSRFSNVEIDTEAVIYDAFDDGVQNERTGIWNNTFFHVESDDSTTTSVVLYNTCMLQYKFFNTGTDLADIFTCTCNICDNGIDFKYDCTNFNGPTTNGTCIPISSRLYN